MTLPKRASGAAPRITSALTVTSWLFPTVLVACLCGVVLGDSLEANQRPQCASSGPRLRHLWGDAFSAAANCLGRDGQPYPMKAVAKLVSSGWGNNRRGRSIHLIDPYVTRQNLLRNYQVLHAGFRLPVRREGRSAEDSSSASLENSTSKRQNQTSSGSLRCRSAPGRLCRSRFNTTAPMYGVSLTSGQPVTIVQKFPDLLQQVVYEQCESDECDVMHGECVQTYIPYLFLVIPLGPVTLTGQDYVLVESGCVCRPKYALPGEDHTALGNFDGFP